MNTFRKICLSAMFLLMTAVCHAYDAEVDGIYYNLDEVKKTASVTYKSTSVGSYSGAVVIPEFIVVDGMVYFVTSIGSSAFKGCSSLTSITISNFVTSIGSYAFSGCSSITAIKIPNSVTSIEYHAFGSCRSLKKLIISDGEQPLELSYNEYNKDWNGEGLFNDCPLETLYLGRNLSYRASRAYGYSPFLYSPLTSVTIGNNVTYIGSYAFQRCMNLESVIIGNNVTMIGYHAFQYCTALASIIIPNSTTSIDREAFENCTCLTSVTIPSSVTLIGRNAFLNTPFYTSFPDGVVYINNVCYTYKGTMPSNSNIDIKEGTISIADGAFNSCNSGLISITIPNSVTYIGEYAFANCADLKSITLGNNITDIGYNAFNSCPANIYVNKGNYTLLSLWNYGIEPYLVGIEKKLAKPSIITTTTQTTATLKILNAEEYVDFVYIKDGKPLENKEWTETYLYPGYSYDIEIIVCKAIGDETVTYHMTTIYGTQEISPSLNNIVTASSISSTGTYIKGDAEVVKQEIALDNQFNYVEGNLMEFTGLEPNSNHTLYYRITLNSGGMYSTNSKVTTQKLTLETEQPKVINAGNVIVKAKSNLNNAETNVGFEWRRTDWTDDFASNTGGAYLYDGEMEGYIRNMATAYLWKYRPYYVSDSGSHYYGEWVGIDPTNTSYFEPTVHTYDNVSVDGNTAKVRGYAQRGTDNITELGFVYWKNNAAAAKANGAKSASSVPGGAQTVTVKVSSSNPVIETTIVGLDYNTDYCYMAFATTDEGTFYGEEQTFKTGGDPTGILDITADTPQRSYPAGIYDLNGRKLEKMQRGVNIVRFEDGTVKKIMVK